MKTAVSTDLQQNQSTNFREIKTPTYSNSYIFWYINTIGYNFIKSTTTCKNSCGFSECTQWPASGMWCTWAAGKRRKISGYSASLKRENTRVYLNVNKKY